MSAEQEQESIKVENFPSSWQQRITPTSEKLGKDL